MITFRHSKKAIRMYRIISSFIVGIILFSSCQTPEEKAAEIHQKVFTIDSHTDTPLKFFNTDFNIGVEHDGRKGEGKIDIPRMEKGGLDAVFFAVFLGQGARDSAGNAYAFSKTEQIFEASQAAVKLNADKAEIATTVEQGYSLEKEGKRAIYFGIENGYPIGNELDNINHFYNLGTRYITLVHTKNNDIADSSTDPKGYEHNGLSLFGESVVERMNELGIMIDVSHASDSAFYDVLKLSKHPVIASHSCARAICDNPRNFSDDMLKAIAKNGGVVQMCILSDYVKKLEQTAERDSGKVAFRAKHSNWANYTEEERKVGLADWYQLDVDFPPILASVSDAVDHIDYMVKVAGINHVGIGTDFDGGGGLEDCFDASELGNITLELVKRGYTEEEIRKIWGGNFMRVFAEVSLK